MNKGKTIIPEKYTKVDKIDYPFAEQRLPFLLGNDFQPNDVDGVNQFLREDDELIRYYLNYPNYPFSCMYISEVVEREMKKRGLSVARINGTVYTARGYDPEFPFGYVLDFDTKLGWDAARKAQFYVVGKVLRDGITNEFIFDYAADPYSKESIVPIVGPRDALRSIYMTIGNRFPAVVSKKVLGSE